MKTVKSTKTNLSVASAIVTMALLAACSPGAQYSLSSTDRIQNMHQELAIVPPDGNGGLSVNAQAIVNIGALYLESQIAPVTVAGTQLQASDLSFNGADGYISYNAIDTATTVIKKGAIEHFRPVICDATNLLSPKFCLQEYKTLPVPTADIFASYTDGSNVYAVGSTLDESAAPHFGRLYKIGLDASKDPTLVSASAVLPSYAGTGVVVRGSKVIATSGTSTNNTTVNNMPVMGGLSYFNLADLSFIKSFPLYDARAVSFNAFDSNAVYVSRAKYDVSTPSSILKYTADGTGTGGTGVATITGNNIAESKSDLAVGKTLILASAGDGGFRIICKANGNVLKTVSAITVAGIPADRTVTNSVVAVPGYIFAANGEGGLWVYSFQKANALLSPCDGGVTLTAIGRLTLGASSTYVNAELSANSVRTMTISNLLGLNLITTRFIMVASGNKGVSMINISAINLSLTDIDDF